MWVILKNQEFRNDGSYTNYHAKWQSLFMNINMQRSMSTFAWNLGCKLLGWITNIILYLILYHIYEKALTTVYYLLPDALRSQILFVNLCPMFLIFSRLSCSNNVMIKAYTVGWPKRGRILRSMIYWACCYSFL